VYVIRDRLANFIDEGLDSAQRGEAHHAIAARHDRVIKSDLNRLAAFRGFLQTMPSAGATFAMEFGDLCVEYTVPSRGDHLFIPGVEKDVAEREYAADRESTAASGKTVIRLP
jgi:hypothetical protein